jgi:hypothetical protein
VQSSKDASLMQRFAKDRIVVGVPVVQPRCVFPLDLPATTCTLLDAGLLRRSIQDDPAYLAAT